MYEQEILHECSLVDFTPPSFIKIWTSGIKMRYETFRDLDVNKLAKFTNYINSNRLKPEQVHDFIDSHPNIFDDCAIYTFAYQYNHDLMLLLLEHADQTINYCIKIRHMNAIIFFLIHDSLLPYSHDPHDRKFVIEVLCSVGYFTKRSIEKYAINKTLATAYRKVLRLMKELFDIFLLNYCSKK